MIWDLSLTCLICTSEIPQIPSELYSQDNHDYHLASNLVGSRFLSVRSPQVSWASHTKENLLKLHICVTENDVSWMEGDSPRPTIGKPAEKTLLVLGDHHPWFSPAIFVPPFIDVPLPRLIPQGWNIWKHQAVLCQECEGHAYQILLAISQMLLPHTSKNGCRSKWGNPQNRIFTSLENFFTYTVNSIINHPSNYVGGGLESTSQLWWCIMYNFNIRNPT